MIHLDLEEGLINLDFCFKRYYYILISRILIFENELLVIFNKDYKNKGELKYTK